VEFTNTRNVIANGRLRNTTTMRYRELGRTGLKVSEISFGCASLSQDYAGRKAPSRKDAIRLLRKAFNAGINLFDTAQTYGQSEEIVGEALGKTDAIIATKTRGSGMPNTIMARLDRSREKLGRECLDLIQIHNADYIPSLEIFDVLAEAQVTGRIKAWGITTQLKNSSEYWGSRHYCMTAQLPYNLLNQGLGAKGFKELKTRTRVGIIARQPYARGLLCNPPWNIGEQALRFCLSNKHISTVLVGMQTEEELEMNLRWAEKGPLPLEAT